MPGYLGGACFCYERERSPATLDEFRANPAIIQKRITLSGSAIGANKLFWSRALIKKSRARHLIFTTARQNRHIPISRKARSAFLFNELNAWHLRMRRRVMTNEDAQGPAMGRNSSASKAVNHPFQHIHDNAKRKVREIS